MAGTATIDERFAQPAQGPQSFESPDSVCVEQSYVQLDSPRSTRELTSRNTERPHKILRARMQTVPEEQEVGRMMDD
jgi:hypothetical protein